MDFRKAAFSLLSRIRNQVVCLGTANARRVWLASAILTLAIVVSLGVAAEQRFPNSLSFLDPSGLITTFSTSPTLDLSGPFFQNLGTNGRTCATCHQASDAWSVTPPHIQARFMASQGLDPIFRPVDGATCPTKDVSTVEARRRAYSLLLRKGLIRIGIQVPGGAEFEVIDVDNPYSKDCEDTANLSMYRRPLPATNLSFLSAVMIDGRESIKDPQTGLLDLIPSLKHQAMDATTGHAQGVAPTDGQLTQIVNFETALFTAQTRDDDAGPLHVDGARGGPVALSHQDFFLGINDPLGGNPQHLLFTPVIFTLYQKWLKIPDHEWDENSEARESIARGERLFNSFPIPISGVAGLNDIKGVGDPFMGTCGTCHDSPNVGDHSLSVPLNIGIADESRRTVDSEGKPDIPLFTLRNIATGKIVKTTDPGRALISGKWADIGKFKGPILRGLAGRAPYFHNGSAAALDDVVDFYQTRFGLGLTPQQQRDLVAFLKTL